MDVTTTPEQIQLIQQSFAKVAPITDQAAQLFYGRLFALAPEVKTLAQGLGATPTLAEAWTAAYKILSGFMIEEANGRGAVA